MYCTNCGNHVPDGAKFCPHCGTPASQTTQSSAGGKTVRSAQSRPMRPPDPEPEPEWHATAGDVQDAAYSLHMENYILQHGGLPASNTNLLVTSSIVGCIFAFLFSVFMLSRHPEQASLAVLLIYIIMGIPWGWRATGAWLIVAWGNSVWIPLMYGLQLFFCMFVGLVAFPVSVGRELAYCVKADRYEHTLKRTIFAFVCLLLPFILLACFAGASSAANADMRKKDANAAAGEVLSAAAMQTESPIPEQEQQQIISNVPSAAQAGEVQTPAPAEAAIPADAPAAATGETFSLTLEQSQLLAEQVAAPLLLTEWDWVMDYDRDGGYYNSSSWKNQPYVRIADLINREKSHSSPYGSSKEAFWNDYEYALANADLQYANGRQSNGRFFGDEAYIADGQTVISLNAMRRYFENAFGDAGLADAIAARLGPGSAFAESSESNRESAQRQYGSGNEWRFWLGDPGSFVDMEVPAQPLQVTGGKVTLRGYINGAWADWSGDAGVWWDITLDVVRSDSSPYGCNVIGYSVTAEDAAPAAAAPSVLTMTPPPAQTPAEAQAPAPRGFDANGLVFADSSERYLTDADLQGLSKEMLAFARNEIFARNGNLFRKDKYIDHYTQYEWYNSIPNKRHDIYEWELNPIEQANIKLIQQYEAA